MLLAACASPNAASPEQARELAKDAYIFAYPMMENYRVIWTSSVNTGGPGYLAPIDEFVHVGQLRTADDTVIVRPNNDTLYSNVMLDLRTEPYVLSVPAIPESRYYSFQLIDMYTNNFAYVGSRETGFEAGDYLIAGPGWQGETPEGIERVLQSEGNFVVALGRTQLNGPDDLPAVHAIQQQYEAAPLSAFLGESAPPAAPELNFPAWRPTTAQSAGFVGYLNFLLGQVEVHPDEQAMIDGWSAIGVSPGGAFDPQTLDPAIQNAMEQGVRDALEEIEAKMGDLGERRQGWSLTGDVFGAPDKMRGRYLDRAAAAMFGLYGNSLEEAYYPTVTMDADGEPLDASKHNYVLHFDADEIPPARSFWSATMYQLPSMLLVHNPISRYSIGDRTAGLQYGNDGSLTLYFQHDNTGGARSSNWLPAPDGPFDVVLRIYWPESGALNPLYVPPPVRKAD